MTRGHLATFLLLALAGCGPRTTAHHPEVASHPACVVDQDCSAGMQCRQGECVPYEGGPGDPCYDGMDCELHLECVGGSCVEPSMTDS